MSSTRSSPAGHRVALLAATALLLVAPLLRSAGAPEARGQAKFEWQGQAVLLEHGKVAVGAHRLDELRSGETWRLGAGAITTLQTEAPLITADGVIPPGWFRASIGRPDEQRLALKLDGAGRWMAVGGDDVLLDGKLSFADPPGKALAITLREATEQPDPQLRGLALAVEFGAPRLTVPLTVVGGTAKKAGGATVTWFKLPRAWLEQRLELAKLTPIATVVWSNPRKGAPAQLNLLLGDRQARLVPQELPPTADGGFGELAPLLVEHDRVGIMQWSAAEVADAGAHFTVDELALDPKATLRMEARLGARKLLIEVPFVDGWKAGG